MDLKAENCDFLKQCIAVNVKTVVTNFLQGSVKSMLDEPTTVCTVVLQIYCIVYVCQKLPVFQLFLFILLFGLF